MLGSHKGGILEKFFLVSSPCLIFLPSSYHPPASHLSTCLLSFSPQLPPSTGPPGGKGTFLWLMAVSSAPGTEPRPSWALHAPQHGWNEYKRRRATAEEPGELWEPEEGGVNETPDHPAGLRGGEGRRRGCQGNQTTPWLNPSLPAGTNLLPSRPHPASADLSEDTLFNSAILTASQVFIDSTLGVFLARECQPLKSFPSL